MRVNFEAKFFFARMLDQNVAHGLDRLLLETALCLVSNETDGSKWSQTPTLDFFHQSSCFPSP